MTANGRTAPVVVGIDGSQAAINAALWAIAEAVYREVPLRLVYAMASQSGPTVADIQLEREYAESALRSASAAVESSGQMVKVGTAVVTGFSGAVLIDEARDAVMVCVGSSGIGAVSARVLGSTATDVAQQALCSVAVIRTPHVQRSPGTDWIAVAVDGSARDDAVVEFAMTEAVLRRAPILAVGVSSEDFGDTPRDELDRQVQVWRDRHPGVHIYPVTTGGTMARFLAEHTQESVQLAVISDRGSNQVAHIIGPHRHPVQPHGDCSVVVVR
jgi:nucleotide-binding universal stress UspA family protein